MAKKIPTENLLSSLKRLSEELGGSVTQLQCNACEYTAGVTTYRKRFGSWEAAKKEAGISAQSRCTKISKEKLLEDLIVFYNREGRTPKQSDCLNSKGLSSKTTYTNVFGSLESALKECGIVDFNKKPERISDQELLEGLRDLSEELGRSVTLVDCGKCSYTAAASTYITRFGTWNKAKKLLGLSTTNLFMSDEELIKSLVDFSKLHNICPKSTDCTKDRSLSDYNTFIRHFGSWDSALEAAGLNAGFATNQQTNEELIQSLIEFDENNRHPPCVADCSSKNNLASAATFIRRFGSWNNAKIAAGLPVNQLQRSIPEIELEEYIKSIYDGEVISSDRTIIKPKELDIVLPDLKLAFEFDGMYWHSTANQPDSKYHLNKTIAAAKAGYTLVHVFESEWFSKQHIVKSRISNLLGSSERVYARKCEVKPLVVSTARVFLEANHLQGYVGASARYGLFYEDELVSVMTFGKPRYNKNVDWELLRFANKCGVSVVGGASRLFKAFTREYSPSTVLSYSDKRWGLGGLYTNLGFEYTHDSTPNYWYLVNGELESRIKYQKHKLDKLLPAFDPKLTEKQNMEAAGYYRIYDCGNAVFLWKKEHVTLEK